MKNIQDPLITKNDKPVVYSCSGCSNLAQMAHNISLNLDGDGLAEMSCISGVIGQVAPIMALAKSGRPIIAIDGCELGCTKACLNKSHIKTDHYYNISALGFEKRDKWDDSLTENTVAMRYIYDDLLASGFCFSQ